MRLLAPAAPVVLALLLLAVPAAAQGTGTWRVTSFRADYTIAPDSTVSVVEELDVDFGIIHKHGIFRYLFDRVPCGELPTDQYDPPEFSCPGGSDRVYRIHVTSVQANNSATPFDVSLKPMSPIAMPSPDADAKCICAM